YPTYEVGAQLVGARVVRSDAPSTLGSERVGLVWLNSPSNPTGRVMSAAQLRETIDWAREQGAVVASDECYLEMGWSRTPESALSVCGGDYTGVLAVHSLSKRSNLAGYRAGFVAGDPALIGELLAVRRHLGMIVPTPVQAAMVVALADDAHVIEQRARYGARREMLLPALRSAGCHVDASEAGLYLWVTRGEGCWATLDWLAGQGILAAPGAVYGSAGDRHVRAALTASDAAMAEVVTRLG
nr:succinyldiaminopimelate transaminase [Longispora sp. (in: high G+C Gram-positive bacteria)]